MTTLRDVFLQHVPGELRAECEAVPDLDQQLDALAAFAEKSYNFV